MSRKAKTFLSSYTTELDIFFEAMLQKTQFSIFKIVIV